jgi:4-amino-4-deoxy-L-arabinose transferase-like glycosyltransferase
MQADAPSQNLTQRVLRRVSAAAGSPMDVLLPVLLLSASAALLFRNALHFSMPIASAGLYAQAAKEIADSGFGLPLYIRFYGPGDLPFAYPPLAFYVMAIFTRLGVSDIVYLRFVPPVLALLGLLVIYLLAKRLAHSTFGAAAALVICATSPSLYGAHAWSSGAVRALAFLLLLCGVFAFDIAVGRDSPVHAAVAGILLALTVLTHLFYGLVFVLWLVFWVAADPRPPLWRTGGLCGITAGLAVAPWLFIMLHRYGPAPFVNGFVSHGNASLLDVLTGAQNAGAWISSHLVDVAAVPLEVPLVAVGVLGAMRRGRRELPLMLLAGALLLSPEGARFLTLVAAMLVAFGGQLIGEWLRRSPWTAAAVPLFLGLVAANAAWSGLPAIQKDLYQVQDGAIELGLFVQDHTSSTARYLLLAEPRDGEWFPYLMQREPFASKWGAEWLGTYDQQIALLSSIDSCRRTRVVACLADLHFPMAAGDILVTLAKDRDVARSLRREPECPEMAQIGAYVVWGDGCLLAAQ